MKKDFPVLMRLISVMLIVVFFVLDAVWAYPSYSYKNLAVTGLQNKQTLQNIKTAMSARAGSPDLSDNRDANLSFGHGVGLRHMVCNNTIAFHYMTMCRKGPYYQREFYEEGLPDEENSIYEKKLLRAIKMLKLRGIAMGDEGYNYLKRARELESETTFVLVDMPTHLLLGGIGRDGEVFYQLSHIGRRRRIIFLTKKALDEFNIKVPGDMKQLATILNHDQIELDLINKEISEEAEHTVTSYQRLLGEFHDIASKDDPFGLTEALELRIGEWIRADKSLDDVIRYRIHGSSQEFALMSDLIKDPTKMQSPRFIYDAARKAMQIGYAYEVIGDQVNAKKYYDEAGRLFLDVISTDTFILPIYAQMNIVRLDIFAGEYEEAAIQFRQIAECKIGGKVAGKVDAEFRESMIDVIKALSKEWVHEVGALMMERASESRDPEDLKRAHKAIEEMGSSVSDLFKESEEASLDSGNPVAVKPGSPDIAKLALAAKFDNALYGDTTNPYIIKHIDEGRAIEIYDKERKVVRIGHDRSNPRAPPVESHFEANGTFEKIREAKDPALLKRILQEKRNFRFLSNEERDNLVRIAMATRLSFILRKVVIEERPAEEKGKIIYTIYHSRTGFSRRRHNLEPTIWMGEILFNRITVEQLAQSLLEEAQHILKPPRQIDGDWINLDGDIDDAIKAGENPAYVIEHDRELINSLDESPATKKELAACAEAEKNESAQGLSSKDVRSRMLELDGREIIDSENEHFILDVKEANNTKYQIFISIKRRSDFVGIGTIQLGVNDTLLDGKYNLELGLADIVIEGYRGRGIFTKTLSLISKIMPPDSELRISSLEETKTLKALADGISWNKTRMGKILYKCGWKVDTISIYDKIKYSTAVLLDRAKRWQELYNPTDFMVILANAIRNIDNTDCIDGAVVSVELSKIRDSNVVESRSFNMERQGKAVLEFKPEPPNMAKYKESRGEFEDILGEWVRRTIKLEEEDIAKITNESLPYGVRRKAVQNIFDLYDISIGNLKAIMLLRDWSFRESAFEDKLGELWAALNVACQELLRSRTDRTEMIKEDNGRLLKEIDTKIKAAEKKFITLIEENGFNASMPPAAKTLASYLVPATLNLGQVISNLVSSIEDIIPETRNNKGIVLYADELLERGTVADMAFILNKTDLLENSTIVLYGRKPGRAELLERIIKTADDNNSIRIITVMPQDLYGKNSSRDINIECPDEAKELEALLRHVRSHGISSGDMLGIIKDATGEDYVAGITSISKEYHTPVVSFADNKGIYSFKEALKLLMAIKDDASPLSNKEWFRFLKPIEKKDIEKAYQDYRRVLEAAINA